MRGFEEFSDSEDDFTPPSTPKKMQNKYLAHTLPLKKKTIAKITDFACRMIEYIAFIPTLVYNLFFLIYFHNIINFNQNVNLGCQSLVKWKGYIITICKVNLTKAFLFLCTSKLCCGNENDLNVLCVGLKALTSFIPSLVFIFKLRHVLDSFEGAKHQIYHLETLQACTSLWEGEIIFLKYEEIYCWFIIGIIGLIVIGSLLAALKEVWKSRGYKIR